MAIDSLHFSKQTMICLRLGVSTVEPCVQKCFASKTGTFLWLSTQAATCCSGAVRGCPDARSRLLRAGESGIFNSVKKDRQGVPRVLGIALARVRTKRKEIKERKYWPGSATVRLAPKNPCVCANREWLKLPKLQLTVWLLWEAWIISREDSLRQPRSVTVDPDALPISSVSVSVLGIDVKFFLKNESLCALHHRTSIPR